MSDIRELLAEALDLCVRARTLDEATESLTPLYAANPTMTRSATPHLWVLDQYDTDLADWERRAREALG